MKNLIAKFSIVLIAAIALVSSSFAFQSDFAQGEETKSTNSTRKVKVETLEEGEKSTNSTRRAPAEEKKAEPTPAPTTSQEEVAPAEDTMTDEEILDKIDDGALTTDSAEVEEDLTAEEKGGSGMLWLILGVAVVVIIIAVVAGKKKK